MIIHYKKVNIWNGESTQDKESVPQFLTSCINSSLDRGMGKLEDIESKINQTIEVVGNLMDFMMNKGLMTTEEFESCLPYDHFEITQISKESV